MNKRGEIASATYWVLIDAVIITLAIAFFFQFIAGVRDNTRFEQQFLARDLALMANTVSTVPGEIIYDYQSDLNISKYDYRFQNSIVSVRTHGEDLEQKYPFYYNNYLSTEFQPLLAPKTLMMQKSGFDFRINEKIEGLDVLCPELETPLSIIKVDTDNAGDLADLLVQRSSQPVISSTTPGNIDARLQLINIDTAAVMHLSKGTALRIGTAPQNPEKVRKLSCLLTKQISLLLPGTEVSTYEAYDSIITKNTNGIGIKIEFGDQDEHLLSSAIIIALREYSE